MDVQFPLDDQEHYYVYYSASGNKFGAFGQLGNQTLFYQAIRAQGPEIIRWRLSAIFDKTEVHDVVSQAVKEKAVKLDRDGGLMMNSSDENDFWKWSDDYKKRLENTEYTGTEDGHDLLNI